VFLFSYTAQRYKTGSFLPNRAPSARFSLHDVTNFIKPSVTVNHANACPNDVEMRLASKVGFTDPDVRNWKRGLENICHGS